MKPSKKMFNQFQVSQKQTSSINWVNESQKQIPRKNSSIFYYFIQIQESVFVAFIATCDNVFPLNNSMKRLLKMQEALIKVLATSEEL